MVVVVGLRFTGIFGVTAGRMAYLFVVPDGCDRCGRRVLASFGGLGSGVGINSVRVVLLLVLRLLLLLLLLGLLRMGVRSVELRMPLWGSITRVIFAIRLGR